MTIGGIIQWLNVQFAIRAAFSESSLASPEAMYLQEKIKCGSPTLSQFVLRQLRVTRRCMFALLASDPAKLNALTNLCSFRSVLSVDASFYV